jgi:hypothetical protein
MKRSRTLVLATLVALSLGGPGISHAAKSRDAMTSSAIQKEDKS